MPQVPLISCCYCNTFPFPLGSPHANPAPKEYNCMEPRLSSQAAWVWVLALVLALAAMLPWGNCAKSLFPPKWGQVYWFHGHREKIQCIHTWGNSRAGQAHSKHLITDYSGSFPVLYFPVLTVDLSAHRLETRPLSAAFWAISFPGLSSVLCFRHAHFNPRASGHPSLIESCHPFPISLKLPPPPLTNTPLFPKCLLNYCLSFKAWIKWTVIQK